MTRKLVGVLFAIWRDGTSYDPSKLRSANASAPPLTPVPSLQLPEVATA